MRYALLSEAARAERWRAARGWRAGRNMVIRRYGLKYMKGGRCRQREEPVQRRRARVLARSTYAPQRTIDALCAHALLRAGAHAARDTARVHMSMTRRDILQPKSWQSEERVLGAR